MLAHPTIACLTHRRRDASFLSHATGHKGPPPCLTCEAVHDRDTAQLYSRALSPYSSSQRPPTVRNAGACILCEEMEALRGMRRRKRRLREYWACVAVPKLCIFDVLLASSRRLLLAKAPKHAQVRLLRQQHRSTDFASATILPYARTQNTAL